MAFLLASPFVCLLASLFFIIWLLYPADVTVFLKTWLKCQLAQGFLWLLTFASSSRDPAVWAPWPDAFLSQVEFLEVTASLVISLHVAGPCSGYAEPNHSHAGGSPAIRHGVDSGGNLLRHFMNNDQPVFPDQSFA